MARRRIGGFLENRATASHCDGALLVIAAADA
jgi:hypothetical protein